MIPFTSSSGVDEPPKQRCRRTGVIIGAVAFAVVLLVVVSCVATQLVQPQKNNRHTTLMKISNDEFLNEVACNPGTQLDPQACLSSFAGFPPHAIFNGVVKVLIGAVKHTVAGASNLKSVAAAGLEQSSLQDCMELLDAAVDDLTRALSKSFSSQDVQTFLSASVTNQETCMEGLAYTNGTVRAQLLNNVKKITQLATGSLATFNAISHSEAVNDVKFPNSHNRRLLFVLVRSKDEDSLPRWLSPADLTLLQVPQSNVRANTVVALDGTGNYKSIAEAVNAAPDNNSKRYLIHVKAGLYHENIVINKSKTNLVFIGDGMDCTIITGNKNFIDGTSTYRSATFAVIGNGFIARDIGFENTAGPHKYQAVALRVGSDESMFYRCSMKGYQDTLYVHSYRQFYRDCKIYGTIDFIFGNAAVVFQDCAILARKPLAKQFITITAQGRTHPDQNTGISIHNCSVTAAPDLAPVKKYFAAYLGRPWQRYSRTAFLHSYLDDIIRPEGWAPWNSSNFALDTLYYGEYLNRGPGAALDNRVKWRGFHAINSSAEANQFSVAQFIESKKGLPPN